MGPPEKLRVNHTPTSIRKQGGKALTITWEDGHVSRYSARYLRQRCSCAACVQEWTGASLLDIDSVPLDLQCFKVEATGNYALSFSFSDYHNTGIYHFEHLRAICPCESCQGDMLEEES